MTSVLITETYSEPPISEKDILRYAGSEISDEKSLSLLKECLSEIRKSLIYRVCYRILPYEIKENGCDFRHIFFPSQDLKKTLTGGKQGVLFAVTVGFAPDRMVARYTKLSPYKALMFQAIGAERVEALCDCFCRDLEKKFSCAISPRFSPGYGDLSLTVQKELLSLLDASRSIGVSLNESLMMLPTKSVTAIAAIREK